MLLDPRDLTPTTQLLMAALLTLAWLGGQVALHLSAL
jgi:hypothetical protein